MEVAGRQSLKKDVKSDLCVSLCQLCQCEGTEIYANSYCITCSIYLCTSCLHFHQSFEVYKTHNMKYLESESDYKVQARKCLNFCEVHETEKVMLYCQRHNYVGCKQCMNLSHETCLVQQSEDVSRHYGNSREFYKIKEEMNNLMADIISAKNEVNFSLNEAKKMKEHQVEKVQTFYADLEDYLHTKKEEILTEVEQIYANDVKFQTKLYDQCETMVTEIREYQEQLDQRLVESHNLFVTAKLAQKKLDFIQGSLKKVVSKTNIDRYKFNPSPDLLTLKENLVPLGTLDVLSKEYRESSLQCNTNMLEFVDKINVKDVLEKDCCITGMVMISGDEILLADNANSSFKVLDINECKVTFICISSSKPFDVTTISYGKAAATLPNNGEILFLNTKNGLTQDSTLKVLKNCRGIDHNNGLLAVSFIKPPTVQVLSMNGKILYQVQDSQVLQVPGSIIFTNDFTSLLVSDFAMNSVIELKINNNLPVLSEFNDMHRPSGLALTKSNRVIVCCTGGSECLGLISCEGNTVHFLKTEHLHEPVSLLISEEQNYMCICENKGSDNCNYIKVFHLKLYQ